MSQEKSTSVVYELTGSTRRFIVPFEYLSRQFVVVTVLGAGRTVLTLGSDYRFISLNEIETTVAYGGPDGNLLIEIRRVTSATDRLVEFADGSVLRSRDMNVSAIQTIHIAEEARDLSATLETNAKASEVAAKTSATNAKASERAAEGFALEAEQSAQAAAQSASQSDAVSLRQDLASPDMGAEMVGFKQEGSGAVERNLADKARESVSVKDFGALCDGITDDTLAVRSAIAYAILNGTELEASGTVRITDEIEIVGKLYFKGTGCQILFDNTEVDSSGNALKGLFKFTTSLSANGTIIEHFRIKYVSQVPNQHVFIFKDSYVVDLDIYDIVVNNATGCIFWLDGDGTLHSPAFHNPKWDSVRGYNVGGLIGQKEGTLAWSAGGRLSRFNIEWKINPVSPQPQMADVRNFRLVTLDSWILEGTGHPTTTMGILAGSEQQVISNLYEEVVTNKLITLIKSNQGLVVNTAHTYGPADILLTGGHSVLNDIHRQEDGIGVIVEGGATYEKNKTLVYDYPHGHANPYIPKTELGVASLTGVKTYSGCTYNQNTSIQVYKLKRNHFLTSAASAVVNDTDGGLGLFEIGSAFTVMPVTTPYDGVVQRFAPVSESTFVIPVNVRVHPQYFGSQVILSIRYRTHLAPLGLKALDRSQAFVGVEDASGDVGKRVAIVGGNVPSIEYQDVHILLGGVTSNVELRLFDLVGATYNSNDFRVYIKDIRVTIGSHLPNLHTRGPLNEVGYATSPPLKGYFVAGDIIYNTEGAAPTGWRKTNSGYLNGAGTDWVTF